MRKYFCLTVIIFLAMAATVEAGTQPILQELTISIDPAKNALTASAEITVPAPESASFNLTGLTVSSITVDGALIDASSLIDNTLALDESPLERKISIDYRLDCTPGNSSPCLISESAAVILDTWHPTPNRDALFKLKATIPDNFEAVSEAETIQTTPSGPVKQVEFHFPHPVRSIHFIAGPYTVEEETFGKDQVLASYFFSEDQYLAESYRKKAKEYLERYSETIGPYPYKRFAIVENRMPTGYAMPTFTLLGQSVVRLPFIIDTSLGHEVLHSWFGSAVRVDRSGGNWCEGLTTYLADQTYAGDRGESSVFRKEQLVQYQSYVNESNIISLDQFSGGDLSTTKEQKAVRAVGYGKSSMIFHMLKEKFGPDIFNRSMQDFYSRMNGKAASWQDIQHSFENIAASSLDAFFSQWLTRKDIPVIDVQQLKLQEKEGQLQLSFLIKQGAKDPYEFDLPLLVHTPNGPISKTITISKEETKVEIPLAAYPTKMVLDPNYDLMRKLTPYEFPPVWERFAGAQNSLAVVSSTDNFDLFEPLIDSLESEGTEVLAADEVTDEKLATSSVIFLGIDGAVSRGLFAQVEHGAQGLTIDTRKNPLNHDHVIVLASTESREQSEKSAAKLRHYGKYSFLHFADGRADSKEITASAEGQQYYLDRQPIGVQVQKTLDFSGIIDDISDKRVVYVGESHTRYEDHKLQLRVIRELFNRSPKLAVGMEMFPRSAQKTLDSFVNDELDEIEFLKQSEYFKVWSYDYRLYREIILFARKNRIRLVGLNIDRDKVSKVYKDGGISGLSPEEKTSIPVDRDLSMPYYRERLNAVFSIHPNHGGTPQFSNFLQAQAIWDETMAESIADYLKENPQEKMIVLAGNGHVTKENAIPPRVKRRINVDQSIIISADGGAVYPPEIDYVIFPQPDQLPPQALMGIMMSADKDKESVIVDGVAPKSGAEIAGIRKNDVLLTLDDQTVSTIEDVKIIMLFKEKGEKIKAEIRRPRAIFPDENLTFEVGL